jgi:hypothetical protein
MQYEWTLTRKPPEGESLLGLLDTQGGVLCYTLEHTSLAIPEGRYPVLLTVSNRAKRGELWSPVPTFELPLLQDVPGRSGIRIHAGNTAEDSVGCILVGSDVQGLSLEHSRPALIRIINLLHDYENAGSVAVLTVRAETVM